MDLYQAFKNHSSKSQIDAIVNSKHFKIDELDDDGLSALHRASREGMLDLVTFLVEKKTEIDKPSRETIGRYTYDHYTALFLAVRGGHNDVAKYLIANGAKINEPYLSLHEALRLENFELVKFLLKKGAKPKLTCSYGCESIPAQCPGSEPALQQVTARGNLEAVKCLVENATDCDFLDFRIKANPHYADRREMPTALHIAIDKGFYDIARYLIDKKADPNILYYGKSPLHRLMTYKKECEIVNYLLEHGADPNSKNSFIVNGEGGRTPMIVATEHRNLDLVKCLMRHNADPNIKTLKNVVPLHIAVKDQRLDIVEYLLQNGANPNIEDSVKQIPLHVAAKLRNYDIVKCLVDHGSRLFHIDVNDLNPLQLLRKSRKGKKVEELTGESKRKIIAFLSSRMTKTQKELEMNARSSDSLDENGSRKRKSTAEDVGSESEKQPKKKSNSETVISKSKKQKVQNHSQETVNGTTKIVQSLTAFLINKDYSIESKMFCVCAIDSIISRDPKTCENFKKKEIVDELATIFSGLVSKIGKEPNNDLTIIANIFCKLNSTERGKKLLSEINMLFSDFQRLNMEMKRLEDNSLNQPNQMIYIGTSGFSEDVSRLFLPIIEDLMNKDNSYVYKMLCVCVIDSMLCRDHNLCEHISKKEIINEIGNLVSEIVSKVGEESNNDLEIIARTLAKVNATNEGEKLIGNLSMSFSAFQILNAQMMKFQVSSHPSQFTFDSDVIKTIKNETLEIDSV